MKNNKLATDIIQKNKTLVRFKTRVDLRNEKIIFIPVKKAVLSVIISFAIITMFLGAAHAPINKGYLLAASNKETERAALEAQLKELEQQIAEYENTVAQYQKQGKSLESEIKKINAKIAQLNLQIKAINLTVDRLDKEIGSTKIQITQTEGDIGTQKEYLSAFLQSIYENEDSNAIEIMMSNPKLSDFFLDLNNLLVTQDNVRSTLEKIVQLKNDLIDQKEQLASQLDDTQQLKAYQEAQRQLIKKTETEKSTLLKETKGQESKYKQIVEEKKKTAAQIRSRLYEFLGGGELSFGEAYRFAKIASDATGVRAAIILAVLDKESALGRNVGKCKYNINPYYPAKANNPTSMHPTRDIPVFLNLMKNLNISPDSVFISCPIPSDGAYGGGMGPAQFIPSTWQMYKDKIASLTGNNPPSPWNNLDAFTATALYLKDAGAAGGSLYQEKVAAAKYYAGGRWKNYLDSYGARVISKAQDFQEDIDVLNGQ